MRQIKEYVTDDGERRYKVRYRLGKMETSETFRRRSDAEMFRDILGDGKDGRVVEAERWLKSKREERETITFADWHETYIEQRTGVTPRTREDYRSYRRRYLADLAPLPLPLINRAHVAALVNRLEREGKSPKTIKNVVHMLSSCLAHAEMEGHIARNPCRGVRLPKRGLNAHQTRYLTPEEFRALIDALDPYYQPFVTFLFGTGLRWSEATALQCRHVDLNAGTVRVEQAWKRANGTMVIGPPKSDASHRTVNAAVDALAAAALVMRKPNDRLWVTPRGGTIHYGAFRSRVWVPACEKAELEPRPGAHSARHTFASWMISEGVSLEAVQDQLGHESIVTTRKVYGHLQPGVGVAAGKAASVALARALAMGPARELS